MAEGSRHPATATARGANCQHLVKEFIPGVGENLGKEGSGRRVGLEEEKDGGRCSLRSISSVRAVSLLLSPMALASPQSITSSVEPVHV